MDSNNAAGGAAALTEKPPNAYPLDENGYRLIAEIGRGVSATVYEAECQLSSPSPSKTVTEKVAIKCVDLERAGCALDDVRREAQTMSLLDHPNVLKAHCSFAHSKTPSLWVVMPFMAGGSCESILKSSPAFSSGFEEPLIAAILQQALQGIAYLHAQGHMHRDIKAGNILIDSRGRVKVADFGVSASVFEAGDRKSRRRTFVGTPCWMAPEVVVDSASAGVGYNNKVDIWSFGITALELAHGQAPLAKVAPMKALLMQISSTSNVVPSLDKARFSRAFRELVAQCLVRDPSRRPSAEALLKHAFFRHVKGPDYLVKHVLQGLPSLAERARLSRLSIMRVGREDDGDDEVGFPVRRRRISGWNFNDDAFVNLNSLQPLDAEKGNKEVVSEVGGKVEREDGKEDEKIVVDEDKGSSEVVEQANSKTSIKKADEDVFDSGKKGCESPVTEKNGSESPSRCNSLDSRNGASSEHKKGAATGVVQKGRFSVTEEMSKLPVIHPLPPLRRMHSLSSHPSLSSSSGASGLDSLSHDRPRQRHHHPSSRFGDPNSAPPTPPSPNAAPKDNHSHSHNDRDEKANIVVAASMIMPHLQSLLESAMFQHEILMALMDAVGVEGHRSATWQREKELTQQIIDLQGNLSSVSDELNTVKAKNRQLQLQLQLQLQHNLNNRHQAH